MATGGEEVSSIFECAVCFNNLLDRTPRCLQCIHSFCEICLIQLVKNNQIICPTCRKTTRLRGNDVKQLPVNFLLHQMKDFTAAKPNQGEGQSRPLCQICKVETFEFKCKDCPSLMCITCKTEHNDTKKFKGHSVFDICKKHEESITDICTECMVPLCITCMLVDHKEHKEYFQDITKGMTDFPKDFSSLKDNIKTEVSKMDNYIDQIQHCIEINWNTEQDLLQRKNYFLNKAKETDVLLKSIFPTKISLNIIKDECVKARNHSNEVIASLDGLTKDSLGFSNKRAELKEKAEDALKGLRTQMSAKYDTPLSILNEHQNVKLVKNSIVGDVHSVVEKAESIEVRPAEIMKGTLEISKLVVDIQRASKMDGARQIDLIGFDPVLVLRHELWHISRLNRHGMIVDSYSPCIKQAIVYGLLVYENLIYIVQPKAITVVSITNKQNVLVYKPDIKQDMGKILVRNKSVMYISTYNENPGNIYEYNAEHDTTEVKVTGLNVASFMQMIKAKDGLRFIVSETGADRVRVYDENWTLLHTFGSHGNADGELYFPLAIAATPMGTLLIADTNNHRICHYTVDGKFLSNVITQKNGIKCPAAIAYKHPYLWVCRMNGEYVKCFQLEISY